MSLLLFDIELQLLHFVNIPTRCFLFDALIQLGHHKFNPGWSVGRKRTVLRAIEAFCHKNLRPPVFIISERGL